ncbi:MAG TPA: VanZ family protein [Alphaproteobacteria bacterium]|jgi:VanZ family protein|nr:VanZ family protein [Alphaproteobacteria bacterium]
MDRSRIAALLAQLAFWGAAAVTLILAVVPESGRPPLIPWDKAAHFLAFYVLTLLAAAAFPRRPLLLLALALSAYGAAIELIQALPIVDRDANVWDWAADSVAIGAALLPLVIPRWRAWLGRDR